MKILNNIIKTLKINHYMKNIVVILPLLFSVSFTNLRLTLLSVTAMFAFCLISSAVYVMNDLIDIKKDKLHPIKSKRPIASGAISKPLAIFLLAILFISSSFIGFELNILCGITILGYFCLNVLYSFWLKNIALIDVACIALGFIFRVIAGCFAIAVKPSPLIILLTFFASMFFTFTKRKLELQLLKDDDVCRKSIRGFDLQTLNQFILLNGTLAIAFYFTYMLDANTMLKAGTEYMYITAIPFTLMGFRLLFLINTSNVGDDPIKYIENDKTFKWLVVFYIVVFACIILCK